MADIIQLRRDTAANWTSVNPVLAQGEIGLELDTKKWKVGDGTTAWVSLPYYYSPNEPELDTIRLSLLAAEFRNVETISAAKTLTDTDQPIQRLTPSGADCDVNLPTPATTNHPFWVVNPSGASYSLVVKSGATELATLAAGDAGLFVGDGAAWKTVSGDMKKSVYDTNSNGIVDDAEALSGITATANPTPSKIPIADASGTLNDWVTTKPPLIRTKTTCNIPSLSEFTWLNQDNATATASSDWGIHISKPATTSTSLSALYKSMNQNSGYKITIGIIPLMLNYTYLSAGLYLLDNQDHAIFFFTQGNQLGLSRYNSPTSFAGVYRNVPIIGFGVVFLRVIDDGTYRKAYFSLDGVNFALFDSVSRTDFLTPTRIGIGVNAYNTQTNDPAAMTVFHFLEEEL